MCRRINKEHEEEIVMKTKIVSGTSKDDAISKSGISKGNIVSCKPFDYNQDEDMTNKRKNKNFVIEYK